MDIARPDIKKKKNRRLLVYAAAGAVVLTALTFVVMRLKPASPTVDRSTIWTDTVKRGPLIRQVRGSTGTLVPREDSIELIPAQTDATVVRIRVLPGAQVTPDTVIMDLSDPTLEQELLNAQLGVKQAQADYKSLQAHAAKHVDGQENRGGAGKRRLYAGPAAGQDRQGAVQLGVISGVAYQKSTGTADQLNTQHDLSQQQLEVNEKAIEVQLASSQTKIDQAKALLDLYQKQQSGAASAGRHRRHVGAAGHARAGGPARDRRHLGGRGDPAATS